MKKLFLKSLAIGLMALIPAVLWAQTLNEGFEGTAFAPEEWSTIHVSGTSTWTRNTDNKRSGLASAYVAYANPDHENYLITPLLSPKTGESLSFYVAAQSYPNTTLTVEISTTTAEKASFTTTLATYTTGAYSSSPIGTTSLTSWVKKTIDLGDYVGQNVYVAFHVKDSNGSHLVIDDVTGVSLYVPACPKPASISFSNLSATEATISWDEVGNAESYELTVGTNKYNVSGATSKTVTGLTANTKYEVSVVTDCGVDGKSDARSTSFRTPIVITKEAPYTEGFESWTNNGFDDAWNRVTYTNGNTYPCASTASYKTGSKSLAFQGGYSTNVTYAVLPLIANDLSTLKIEFQYKNYSTSTLYGQFTIGTVTDPSDLSTFTSFAILPRTSSFTLYEKDLAGVVSGTGKYLAIEFYDAYASKYNNYSAYIDDIKISLLPTCIVPTALTSSDVSMTTAQIDWTAGKNEENWNMQYKKSSESTWTDVDEVIDINSYTLEDLAYGTSYDVRVRAYCSADDQSVWSDVFTFSTECDSISLVNYSEDFESYTASSSAPNRFNLPCWKALNYSKDRPAAFVSTGSYISNGKGLRFTANKSGDVYAVMPAFKEGFAGYRIKFQAKFENATNGKLYFGYLTKASQVSTWTSIQAIANSTSVSDVVIELNNVPAGARLAFKFGEIPSNVSTYYDAGIDNIVIEPIPNCTQPSGLAASDVQTTSAKLSWTAGDAETAWNIRYRKVGAADWTAATGTVVSPFTLTGLSKGTNYEAQVQAVCNENESSDWTASANFTTECGEISEYPFVFGFEDLTAGNTGYVSSTFIDCWTRISNTTNGTYIGFPYISSSYCYAGSRCLAISTSYYCGTEQYVVLPKFDTSVSNLSMSFFARYGSTSGTIKIVAMGDPTDAETYTQVTTLSVGSSSYTQKDVDFTKLYSGDAQYIAIAPVRSSYSSSGNTPIYIDNITVSKITCKDPSNLGFSNVGTDSAVLAWTANGSETQWLVKYKKSSESTWQSSIAETKPYTLKGLDDAATYNVEVYAYCSAQDQSKGAATGSFSTTCEAISLEPDGWSENFNSYTSVAASDATGEVGCFRILNHVKGDYPKAFVSNNSTYAVEGNCMLLQAYNGKNAIYAVLPLFEQNMSAYRVKFDTKFESTSYGKLYVGYLTNASDASTWTALQQIVPSAAKTKDSYTINLATVPNGASVAFRYGDVTSSWYQVGIDNVVVEKAPSCVEITGLTVSDITPTSASVSWTAGSTEQAWDLRYKVATASEWTSVAVSVANYSLTGLALETAYEVQVRAHCNDQDQSAWSASQAFTTGYLPYQLPFDEGFEGCTGTTYSSNGEVPANWTAYSTSSIRPHVISSGSYFYKHSGTKSLTFYGYGSNYAALPKLAVPMDSLDVTFWKRQQYSSYGELTLGYITAGDVNMNTFTVIKTFSKTNTMDSCNIKLNEYSIPATADRLVFRWVYTTNSYTCCIDDIHIEKVKCASPEPSVDDASITTNSAILSSGLEDIAWAYKVGEQGAVINVAANQTAELLGLEANTVYTVHVQSVCSANDKSEFETVEFRTECNPIAALGYEEDFDSESTLPVCMKSKGAELNLTNGVNGTKCVGMSLGQKAILLPSFASTTDYSALALSFDAKSNTAGSAIYVITYDKAVATLSAQTVLATIETQTGYSETPYLVDFSVIENINDLIGSKRIGFYRAVASGSYVDNIKIIAAPTFKTPLNLAVVAESVTEQGASFTFSQPGVPTNEWVAETATDSLFTEVVSKDTITSTAFSVDGLDMDRTYFVRVAQLNGQEKSPYSNRVKFTTICAETMPLNKEFTFDWYKNNTFPTCWSAKSANASYTPTIDDKRIKMSGYNAWLKGLVTSPALDETVDNTALKITFKAKTYSGSAVLKVGVANCMATDVQVGTVDDAVKGIDLTITSTLTEYNLMLDTVAGLTDAYKYVAFMVDNDGYYTIYIDDITVSINNDWELLRGELAEGQIGTTCQGKNITAVRGGALYGVNYGTTQSVEFAEKSLPIAAGEPLLFLADGTNEGKIEVVYGSATADVARHDEDKKGVNGLVGLVSGTSVAIEAGNILVSGGRLRLTGDDCLLTAGHAYIEAEELPTQSTAPARARRLILTQNGTAVATGTDEVMNGNMEGVKKIVRDGQLIIIRGGQFYNAQGQVLR